MRATLDEYADGPGTPASRLKSHTVKTVAGLGTDRDTIPANGTAFATLNYAGPEPSPHAWTVNGAASNIPAALDPASGLMVSEIEVTAAVAGPIEIVAVAATLTLTAV